MISAETRLDSPFVVPVSGFVIPSFNAGILSLNIEIPDFQIDVPRFDTEIPRLDVLIPSLKMEVTPLKIELPALNSQLPAAKIVSPGAKTKALTWNQRFSSAKSRFPVACHKHRVKAQAFSSASQALHSQPTGAPTAHRKVPYTMPTNPKTNQQKMERMLNAWETLAPTKSFGGMTLAQFQAAAQPAQAARQQIEDLEDQLTQALATRDAADEAFLAKAQLVVNGVLADPTEGADSALYEAMGYTRKSERRSGLTRKSNKPPTQ